MSGEMEGLFMMVDDGSWQRKSARMARLVRETNRLPTRSASLEKILLQA
jgi:hypothetical protein